LTLSYLERTPLAKQERERKDTKGKEPDDEKYAGGTILNDITDPKQLDDFQQLDVMIETTVAHFEHYDVADVFSIVFPDSNGNLAKDSQGNVKTVNLFSHFTDLSVKEVAASNRWYSEYTDDSQDQFHTNLEWTRAYFVNNFDPGLYSSISDHHKRHSKEEQGGPLLFIFMLLMHDLFFVAQKTASTLHSLLKKFRINTVPGENIKTITSTVTSISR
jgi:hypothetical protein